MHAGRIAIISGTLALLTLAGCTHLPGGQPAARAVLEPRSGSQVSGTVSFTPRGERLLVEAELSGLTPGEHGFHVHEGGDCSAPDASSAKGHFNPTGKPHGHHHGERHAGDLPNLVAGQDGRASYRAEVEGLTADSGALGIIGRSVVVHADADDYRSQPAGNSGRRIACGVIRAR